MTAKAEAVRRYTIAYETLAEDEQVAVALGEYDRAAYAHAMIVRLLRAVVAETDDPEPKPTCACGLCVLLRVT